MIAYPDVASLRLSRPCDGVLVLCLARPTRKNALDRQLVLALGDALTSAAADDSVRVVALTGQGGAFCSGADLPTIANVDPEEIPQRIDEFHRTIHAIVEMPKLVVACVDGPAVGFGADLALASDLRILSSRAYFEEGFVKVGLMPDGGGTYWMEKFCGGLALELLVFGTRLDAAACLAFGITGRILSVEDWEQETTSLLTQLASQAPLALREIKSATRAADRAYLPQVLKREHQGQSRLATSEDFQEGVRAFLEKRPPHFCGK